MDDKREKEEDDVLGERLVEDCVEVFTGADDGCEKGERGTRMPSLKGLDPLPSCARVLSAL